MWSLVSVTAIKKAIILENCSNRDITEAIDTDTGTKTNHLL